MANLELMLAKRKQAQALLAKKEIPVWITIVADNKAETKHRPLIGAPFGSTHKAYILTPDRAVVLVHNLEADDQRNHGFEVIEIQSRNVIIPLAQHLEEIVGGKRTPIALNYSFKYPDVDTFGFGSNLRLHYELMKSRYVPQFPTDGTFIPADELIFELASAKLPQEIELLREAAIVTNQAMEKGFAQLKSGMTEIQAAEVFHDIVEALMADDKDKYGYSWPSGLNPIVLTGEGIAGSPHTPPSERILEPGNTVYVDFGISVEDYGGDLQHMGYILKPDENTIPNHVSQLFLILQASINAAMGAALPGTLGWKVDKVGRDMIEAAGHPTFRHGLGHQLGAGGDHAPGASFSALFDSDYSNTPDEGRQDSNPYSLFPIQAGHTMTIEPRIQIKNGASMEVDGEVTEEGFKPFVPMQESVHLIR